MGDRNNRQNGGSKGNSSRQKHSGKDNSASHQRHKGKRRNEASKKGDDDHESLCTTKQDGWWWSQLSHFAAVLVVAASVLMAAGDLDWLVVGKDAAVDNLHDGSEQRDDDQRDVYERVNDLFRVGGKVSVRRTTGYADGGAGLFAKQAIKRGDVLLQLEPKDRIRIDLLQAGHPGLARIVDAAFAPFGEESLKQLSKTDVLSVTAILLEVDRGSASYFYPYIQALPRRKDQPETNSTTLNVAWYWTQDEMRCVVPRPHGAITAEVLQQELIVFRKVFSTIASSFKPLQRISQKRQQKEHDGNDDGYDEDNVRSWSLAQQAEWAYLMIMTRSFGFGELAPMIDMANHDPTQSVAPFHSNDGFVMVATKDIAAGEEVFNSYGHLYPSKMAEKYAFVDPNAAFVNAPSLDRAIRQSSNTNNIEMCTSVDMVFFGNVTEGRVYAKGKHNYQTKYYKPFRPDELSYQCARVLLQSEDGPTIGKFFADTLEPDAASYEAMATAPHCQSDEGNYPLIRSANRVSAEILRNVIRVARQAERGEVEYPDVPYP